MPDTASTCLRQETQTTLQQTHHYRTVKLTEKDIPASAGTINPLPTTITHHPETRLPSLKPMPQNEVVFSHIWLICTKVLQASSKWPERKISCAAIALICNLSQNPKPQ